MGACGPNTPVKISEKSNFPSRETMVNETPIDEETAFTLSIELQSIAKSALTINVVDSMKLFELKQTLSGILNLDCRQFSIYLKDSELTNESFTLKDYGINKDITLKLLHTQHTAMAYADPGEVLPGLLLMRNALAREKREIIPRTVSITDVISPPVPLQKEEEEESVISITLQQDDENEPYADKSKEWRLAKDTAILCEKQQQQSENEDSKVEEPVLKYKTEIFSKVKTYMERIKAAESEMQEPEDQSELTSYRDNLAGIGAGQIEDLHGPFYGINLIP